MYYIYKYENKNNGKIYIGKTNNIERRKKEHLNKKDNNIFHRALLKHGVDNFNFNILDSTDDKNKINELEKYYIKKYNSYYKEKGYNMTYGGDGDSKWNLKKVAVYDLSGKLLNIYNSLSDAKDIYKISSTTQISKSCKEMKRCKEYMFRYVNKYIPKKIKAYERKNKRTKEIYQFSIEGNLIKKYSSIHGASIETNVNRTTIMGCLKKTYKSAGGYIWCYNKNDIKNLDRNNEIRKYINDKIVMVNENNVIVGIYNNCSEAMRKNNLKSYKNISKGLNSITHNAYGYKWYKRSYLSQYVNTEIIKVGNTILTL